MVRPWKAGNYPNIGNQSVFVLFGWRFVIGIIMSWEGRESPSFQMSSRLWEKIKLLLSLLLVNFAQMSSTKDLLNRQTCQGMSPQHLSLIHI